jgi:dTDP-4-dehydrorhamnose 3,5-epimerase
MIISNVDTELPGVTLLVPTVFKDERGFFFESFNQKHFVNEFVQDNHSCSEQNVLRGLHYQVVKPQGKLVRAVVGAILDVAVDIRKSSPTFGKHVAVVLSLIHI